MFGHAATPITHHRELRKHLLACALGVTTLLTLIPLHAAAADEEPLAVLAEVEGITQYRLDNGLEVLLFPDPSVSTFTVNITYLVGSRHESDPKAKPMGPSRPLPEASSCR